MNPLLILALAGLAWLASKSASGRRSSGALPRPPAPPSSGGGSGPGTVVGPPNVTKAEELAPVLLADLLEKGAAYDRELLRAFQAAAGILVDGLYGPESKATLERYTQQSAPPAIFGGAPSSKPAGAVGPPNVSKAQELAPVVAADIAEKGKSYDRELVRAFQAAAGLAVDGDYGPRTRGALVFFGLPNAPAAIFGRGTVAYTPPKG